MNATRSICIRCGGFKRFVSQACNACGFEPTSDEDIAKSFLLSTEFDAGGETFGKSNNELREISERVRDGQYTFDAEEVHRHLTNYWKVKWITPKILIVDLVKWVGPPILILAAVYALIVLNK